MGRWLGAAKVWARSIKRDVLALWIAARDPRTPVLAKLVAAAVAAYALSPIDLIPEVLPVLGLLDDLLIVPLGMMLAIRLVPPALMAQYRVQAALKSDRPVRRAGLLVVLIVWCAATGGLIWVWVGR